MKKDIKELTSSNIRYLITILSLENSNQTVKSVDIAEQLGVTKTSVHKMLSTLSDFGFINKERYGAVDITDKGRIAAQKYTEAFNNINNTLRQVIPYNINLDNSICAILAQIPQNSSDIQIK